jgi:hypothetical protein
MSTLTTPNAQSLNFGSKIKRSTSEWTKTKDKLKKGHLVRENRKTQEMARKQQMTNEKVKKNSALTPNFLNAISPLW